MYLSGVWMDADKIIKTCDAIEEIAPDANVLSEYLQDNWWPLFLYYSGTTEYIDELKRTFNAEKIWEIFTCDPENVQAFESHPIIPGKKEHVMHELIKQFRDSIK